MAERKSTKGQKTRVRCLTPLSTIVHCITYFDNDVTNTYHFLRGFQFSTIPPISAKRTITSHLNSWNTKKIMTSDVGNTGPGLGQAQICGGVNINSSSIDN
jgi:hypothetical protein